MEDDDVYGWQAGNLRFHELVYAATRNPYLRQDILRTLTGYYRRHAFGALGRLRSSFEQHGDIAAALRRRDATAAATAMVSHMRPACDAESPTNFVANPSKEEPNS